MIPRCWQRSEAFGEDIPVDGRSPQEMLTEAVAAADRADVVVAVLGETSGMSGEAASRSHIGLPQCQEEPVAGAGQNRQTASCWC